MAITYAQLTTAVSQYLENDGATFTTNIDRFIRSAERRIHLALELPSARKNNTSLTTTASNPYMTIPTDTIAVLDLAIVNSGVHTLLRKREEGFIREAYTDIATTGTPTDYSIYDENTVLLGPTPDANYSTELTYHGVPTSIVDDSTTWVGNNCERALLYGTLAEGYTYEKGDPDLMKVYENAFQEEIVKMNAMVAKRSHDADMFSAMFNRG